MLLPLNHIYLFLKIKFNFLTHMVLNLACMIQVININNFLSF
jgi:hypothetical protein